MADADQVLETLRRGVGQVTNLWATSGRNHGRVQEVLALADRVTCGASDDGTRWTHRGGPEHGSEARVVVLRTTPASWTGLGTEASFQTWPELWGDQVPTVYVRSVRFTTLWAGVVLCHELDHALEYQEGVSKPGESRIHWDSAEGHVHQNEAVLLDAIADGRFAASVARRRLDDLLRSDPIALASELMTTIPARLQPHRSDSELLHRRGSLIMSAAMLSALNEEAEPDLGRVYHRAWDAWGYGAG